MSKSDCFTDNNGLYFYCHSGLCVLLEVRMLCPVALVGVLDLAVFPQVLDLMPTSLPILFTVFLCGGAEFLQYP